MPVFFSYVWIFAPKIMCFPLCIAIFHYLNFCAQIAIIAQSAAVHASKIHAWPQPLVIWHNPFICISTCVARFARNIDNLSVVKWYINFDWFSNTKIQIVKQVIRGNVYCVWIGCESPWQANKYSFDCMLRFDICGPCGAREMLCKRRFFSFVQYLAVRWPLRFE